MMLSTHFGNLDFAPSARTQFADLMLSSVERFQSRIRKMNVSVRDINGPKGGIDKQCRCVIHLKRMSPIVIEDADDNLQNLVNRIADRVSYTLSQKIDKVRQGGRRRSQQEVDATKSE